MRVKPTPIPGCFELQPEIVQDRRGCFVKTVHRGEFSAYGLESDFAEQYYTISRPGVIRGLHFQVPPHAHAKLVYCVSGRALDAVLDVRAGSPTFRQHYLLELSAERSNMIYLPRGLAHGFCTLEAPATMIYCVGGVYAPQHDTGVLWNSAGISWPLADPILSERDCGLPRLDAFETPFRYEGVPA
jgi:dTDP-4-dehydrorhamnose 3,5-epimerase